MRPYISNNLRQLLVERAQNRCEYCGLAQQGQAATFHVDHIFPVSAGGETAVDNLALACVGCSLHKAARLTAPDPDTGEDVPLFHPRQESWLTHFRWDGVYVAGLTPNGKSNINCTKNESSNHAFHSCRRTNSRSSPAHPKLTINHFRLTIHHSNTPSLHNSQLIIHHSQFNTAVSSRCFTRGEDEQSTINAKQSTTNELSLSIFN